MASFDPSSLLPSLQTGSVSGWVLVAVVVLALIKAWPALKKLKVEEDGSLRKDLLERITALEASAEKEREDCAERIDRIEKRHTAEMGKLEADIRLLRHEKNNQEMVVNYLITRIKAVPELQQIAVEAEDMMARHKQAIALEKGAMLGVMQG